MLKERKRKKAASLSLRLKEIRRQKGWTQARLAAEAGTSRRAIQEIESGEIPYPRNIDRIARALEVSPWWLMFRIE